MGSRTERLREAQEDLDRRPRPAQLTRATEHLVAPPKKGVVTYICIAFAALGALWAIGGLSSANPAAFMQGLGGAIFWGLLAWLNEYLRERARQRQKEI